MYPPLCPPFDFRLFIEILARSQTGVDNISFTDINYFGVRASLIISLNNGSGRGKRFSFYYLIELIEFCKSNCVPMCTTVVHEISFLYHSKATYTYIPHDNLINSDIVLLGRTINFNLSILCNRKHFFVCNRQPQCPPFMVCLWTIN